MPRRGTSGRSAPESRTEPAEEPRESAPRRSRGRSEEKPLALGFFGIGEITLEDLSAQCDDLVGKRDATVYLGISKDTEVDQFSDVIDWAADAKVPVTAYVSSEGLSRNADAWSS